MNINEEVILDDDELENVTQSGDAVLTSIKKTIRARYGLDTEFHRPRRQPPDISVLEDDADGAHSIADMTNDMLSNLLSEYTAFTCWLGQEVADAEAARRLLDGNVTRVKALIALKLQQRKVPQAQIPAQVNAHTIVTALTLAADRERAFEEILEARYKAYSKSTNLLSRIVTIRTGIDEGGASASARTIAPGKAGFRQPKPGRR
jgi:hypothetical protein